jgi:ATP-dependent Lon protease
MKQFILPLRDLIVHPGLTVPIYIDNPMSIACIGAAMEDSQKIILAAQHTWNYPTNPDDIYHVGTIGDIAQVLRLPDGAIHSIVRTTGAVNISDIKVENGLFSGQSDLIQMQDDSEFDQTLALRDTIAKNMQILSIARKFKMDKLRAIMQNYPLPAFVDSVIQLANIGTEDAINILTANSWRDKLVLLLEQTSLMAETAKIEDSINRRVHAQMEGGRWMVVGEPCFYQHFVPNGTGNGGGGVEN